MVTSGDTKVSIAAVLFNEEANLPNLFESLEREVLSQVEPDQLELIFIDNASTDRTLASLAGFQQRHVRFSVLIVQRTQNHLAQARNEVLSLAKSNWIAFLDGDTTLQPGWWRGVQRALSQVEPSVALIGGESRYQSRQQWHQAILVLASFFPLGKRDSGPAEVSHVPTNNCLIRREPALKTGGFLNDYQRVGEDLDLSVALRQKSYRVLYDPQFSVKHLSPSSRLAWYKKMFAYGQAQTRVLLRRSGGIPLVKFLPLLLLVLGLVLTWQFPWFMGLTLALVVSLPILGPLVLSVVFYGLGELFGALPEAWLAFTIAEPKQPHRPDLSEVVAEPTSTR